MVAILSSTLKRASFPVDKHKKTVLLFAIVALGFSFSVLFAVLGPLGREIGLTEFQISSILAASSLTMFLASPRWGRVSDRVGRKRIMIIGLLGYVVGNLLFTSIFKLAMLGVLIPIAAYFALMLARTLNAILMSAIMPSANAYMADITDESSRTKGMGAVGAANNMGAIIGPAGGGLLAGITLLTPLWVASGVALITAGFVYFFLPESPSSTRATQDIGSPKLSYFDSRILPYIIVGVLMFVGTAIVQQTLPFRFQDTLNLSAQETAQTFGMAMGLSAACSLASQLLIMQRFSLTPYAWLCLSLPFLIGAYFVLAIAETQFLMVLAMMVQGAGMGIAAPAFTAGSSLAVRAEEQGAVAGLASSCGPLGFTLGPLIGGFFYQVEPDLPYWFTFWIYLPLFLFVLRAWYLSREGRTS
jgi:MFS family permease